MPAARAISTLCSTTLVEPPMAMATVTALRSEAGVTMSLGPDAPLVMVTRQSTSWSGNSVSPAGVVRGRRHHVQRLEAQHGDERLHGVVGEHAPAAALTGAGVQRVPGATSSSGWPRPGRPTRGRSSARDRVDAGLMEPSERMTAGVRCSRARRPRCPPAACRRPRRR
jgi:hypothetical protein